MLKTPSVAMSLAPSPSRMRGERRCVRMRITPQARPAQEGPVEQGGVVQSVLEHLIAAPGQGRDHAQIRHVAGGEEQRPWPAGEVRQLLLQGMVGGAVTRDQMCRPAADAVLVRTPLERRDHFRVTGEPQVVVAAEREHPLSVDQRPRSLRTDEQPPEAVKVGLP